MLTSPSAGHWWRDPVVLLVSFAGVLVGLISGQQGGRHDIDERVYLSVLEHMQDGDSYYEAAAAAIEEKDGAGPSQVRSLRTPVLATLLALLPDSARRPAAALPGLALCLGAAALAGPDIQARRLASGIAAVWMIVSLPLLYLHHELWGAALLAFAGLQLRRGHDGRAAALCLAATAVRELFGLSLIVGLVLRRLRVPWVLSLVIAAGGGVLHMLWARRVLDPQGYDPPLKAIDSYLAYVSPGAGGGGSQVLGAVLLLLAGAGFWMLRHRPEWRFLVAFAVPSIVATGLSGRVYWSLTWCAITSAAAGVAVSALLRRRVTQAAVP